jgi:RNA polymerase subunit RPABC4/transcription elongation factor Spt4
MPTDEFICPVCGATVPAKARACPECGSDEKTGWSNQTIYDDTGIEDPDEFDYDRYVRREFGKGSKRSSRQWLWWVVALVALGMVVWLLVMGH